MTIAAAMSRRTKRTSVISAMDLRREPGTYLDRVDYRNEAFIIKRAGRLKAALISMRQYRQLVHQRKAAKNRLWKMTDELRTCLTPREPKETESAINEASVQTRADSRKRQKPEQLYSAWDKVEGTVKHSRTDLASSIDKILYGENGAWRGSMPKRKKR